MFFPSTASAVFFTLDIKKNVFRLYSANSVLFPFPFGKRKRDTNISSTRREQERHDRGLQRERFRFISWKRRHWWQEMEQCRAELARDGRDLQRRFFSLMGQLLDVLVRKATCPAAQPCAQHLLFDPFGLILKNKSIFLWPRICLCWVEYSCFKFLSCLFQCSLDSRGQTVLNNCV